MIKTPSVINRANNEIPFRRRRWIKIGGIGCTGVLGICLLITIIAVVTDDRTERDTPSTKASRPVGVAQSTTEPTAAPQPTKDIPETVPPTSSAAPTTVPTSAPEPTPTEVLTPTPVPVAMVPQYEIVYELSSKRFDGGLYEYVLISPVDLSNDSFKNDVKAVVKDIVEQKGTKITIEIHDDRRSLEVSYKQYGDGSLGRNRTEEEGEIQAVHFVATYIGDLSTNVTMTDLQFFTAAFTDHPIVGQYVGEEEWDPTR